jgi:hypothetical protein
MDRKIIGIGIGAVLVISIIAMMGFAFAQDSKTVPATGFIDANDDGVCDNAGDCPYKEQAGGFADADGDGVCDNAANCPMHQNRGGCHGSGGCPMMKGGFKGGCQGIAAATD